MPLPKAYPLQARNTHSYLNNSRLKKFEKSKLKVGPHTALRPVPLKYFDEYHRYARTPCDNNTNTPLGQTIQTHKLLLITIFGFKPYDIFFTVLLCHSLAFRGLSFFAFRPSQFTGIHPRLPLMVNLNDV